MMNVVLVCIGNYQEYILSNIRQLIRLGHSSIYVITEPEFVKNFAEFQQGVTCIDVNKLQEKFEYHKKTKLNGYFRNGFTIFTSSRFFYLYAFMKKYNVEHVLHLENDVPIYYHTDILEDKIDRGHVYIPVDSLNRAIASVVYIPNFTILGLILEHYAVDQNDMVNFSNLVKNFPGWFRTFPIGSSSMATTEEEKYVTKNWEQFNMIFDAAAIGQYIGGVDPQNISGDSRGFINETCTIKYNKYEIVWEEDTVFGIRRPFLIHQNDVFPIFNLHIHCKELDKYTG